jgi:hypothetical protein
VNQQHTENPMTTFERMAAAGAGLISITVAINVARLTRSPKLDLARLWDASSAFHVSPCDARIIPIQNRKPLVRHLFNIELTSSKFEKCESRLTLDGTAFTIKPEGEKEMEGRINYVNNWRRRDFLEVVVGQIAWDANRAE